MSATIFPDSDICQNSETKISESPLFSPVISKSLETSPIMPPETEPISDVQDLQIDLLPKDKYRCDCGKTFASSQAKAGHCHFCVIHQANKMKRDSISELNSNKRKREDDDDEEYVSDSSSYKSTKKINDSNIEIQQPVPTKPSGATALLFDEDQTNSTISVLSSQGSVPLPPPFGSAVLSPKSVSSSSSHKVHGQVSCKTDFYLNFSDEISDDLKIEDFSFFSHSLEFCSSSSRIEKENLALETSNARLEERLTKMRELLRQL